MKKRVIAFVLIILLVLPIVLTAGSVFAAQISKSDNISENGRYIVKFKSDASDSEIAFALSGISHSAISDGENKLFAIVPNEDFFYKFSNLIDYYEPDSVRTVLATTDDPIEVSSYDRLSVRSAWDYTVGESDVIVAVLDTGVDRSHEELVNAKILPGYDAVTRTSGIDIDPVGHGTGIIGLIAATANNALGFAGIANGVTILPVRVSETGTDIYSSDLIEGIRYAADSGAKIINMSIGGFASSYAEQEAINYAISKGCILIAAAGNGGDLPYADQKCYPASYEGVISVASCDKNGKRSSFSQYNDAIDVAAPGENVPIIYTEEGVSKYKTDSGTSYSCAFVSGIAALVASYIDEAARFENEEFISLIVETCGQKRTDALGHGIIDARRILNASKLPIVSGVINGGDYPDSVTVRFNRGSATLDDEPIEDGETIVANGQHTLIVTDGENKKTIKFNLNYDPLYYDYHEFPTYSFFEFERGTALLDGFPYKSKDKITTSGKHTFVLFDGDERREKEIYIQYKLPTVFGVKDGTVYTDPVNIHIIGDGRAELDGKAVYGEIAVLENGKHTLTVFSGNDAVSKTYNFEIDFPYATTYKSTYGNANVAIDEQNGFFFVYNDSLIGTAVYDINAPEQYLHFLEIGRIYEHLFRETELLLFGDNGIFAIDRASARTGEIAIKETFVYENATLYTHANGEIYVFANGSLMKINSETKEAEHITELPFVPEKAIYENGKLCLLSPSVDNIVRILNLETLEITEFDAILSLYGKKTVFADGYFAVGNRVYNAESGSLVLETASNSAVMIKNGLFYADNKIFDIPTGKEKGVFPSAVAEIYIGTDTTYVFGVEPYYTFIKKGSTGVTRFGAARKNEKAFGESQKINDFRSALFYDRYSPVIDSAVFEDSVYLVFDGKNTLFGFSKTDLAVTKHIPLRYIPSEIDVFGGYMTVLFASADEIYLAPANDVENGIYIPIFGKCSSAFMYENVIYALVDGILNYRTLDGLEFIPTEIKASQIATDGKFIYALDDKLIRVYDFTFAEQRSLAVEGERFIIDNVIAVGKNVYALETLDAVNSFPSNIIAIKGNTVVTANGIYNLENAEYIGNIGVNEPESAIICDDNSVLTVGNAIISISSFGNGLEVSKTPTVNGVVGDFLGSTVIEYDSGKGFLDGEYCKSGTTVSEIGNHNFILVLPCGRSINYDFSVRAALSGIEFTTPHKTISIGESVTLKVKYLPDTAPKIPINFRCETDGLRVDENGKIKALKDGQHTVIAEAETDYGTFKAECVVTVVNTLISPVSDSSLTVDRDNGFLLGLLPNTKASDIKSNLNYPKDIKILDKNGEEVSELVGTGAIIRLIKNGVLSDELKTVLIGDLDGDSFVTAYDLYLIEQLLRGKDFPSEIHAAADINGDGKLGDNDYRALKNIILKRTESSVGEPTLNLFGKAYGQVVSKVHNGEYVDVVICLESCKNIKSLSGSLGYGNGLEFINMQTLGWKVDIHEFDKKISFYAYDSNGSENKDAFTAVFSLRFRINAPNGESTKIISEDFTAVFNNRVERIIYKPTDIIVSEPLAGDFNVEFFNAYSFNFDPSVRQYKATIPHNGALADIAITAPEDETVAVTSYTVPDDNQVTIFITRTDKTGETTTYSIEVKRDKEPRFNSDCSLSMLKIDGFAITPMFNPDILNYSVSVPFGTESVTINALAHNNTAKVVVGDTTLKEPETRIPIIVGAPDGEVLTYSVTVTILPEETVSEETNERNDGGINYGRVLAVVAILVAVFAVILVFVQSKKEPTEPNEPTESTKPTESTEPNESAETNESSQNNDSEQVQ